MSQEGGVKVVFGKLQGNSHGKRAALALVAALDRRIALAADQLATTVAEGEAKGGGVDALLSRLLNEEALRSTVVTEMRTHSIVKESELPW